MSGKLIVIEGIDNTGKTTTCREVSKILSERGEEVVFFQTPIPELKDATKFVRKNADRVSHFLFHLASQKFVEKQIIKLLSEGKYVICDRWYYTTFAYHKDVDIGIRFGDIVGVAPEYSFLLICDEDERMRRADEKSNPTEHDKERKEENSVFDRIEKSLKAYDLLIIDNTNHTLLETAEIIIQIIDNC